MMKFSKYHALGNDYLVVEHDQFEPFDTAENVERICADHFGIGADGILVRQRDPDATGYQVRMLNADGSEAKKSGNGLRIFSRYLWDCDLVQQLQPFDVVTPGGRVTCQVSNDGRIVTVDMGKVSFNSHDIPVTGPPRDVIQEKMAVDGEILQYSAAGIGNPHCVIVREKVTSELVQKLGPLIETESRFPNLTNVQFVQVIDRANLWAEIWERRVGYTLASGTSGCAVAAVARRLDLCDSEVNVHMPGGRLQIEVQPDFSVSMTGPVVKVSEGQMSSEVFDTDVAAELGVPNRSKETRS